MALEHCILEKFLRVSCHCFPPPLDVPTFSTRCLHVQRRERPLAAGEKCSDKFRLEFDFHVILDIFYMPKICDMGQTALLALKNPMASAGFEPANLGTKGQHATSRPRKPIHSEYVILIAFPLRQWLYERASTLRYTYITYVVTSYTTSYVSLSLFSTVFGVLLLHKPIPYCVTRRSTPTAPQDHRFNPNQAIHVYSCLLTSPLVVTTNNDPVHHTTGLLACQKYPLPQYYH
jgi:hypothetical protein